MARRVVVAPYQSSYTHDWHEEFAWQGMELNHPVKISGEQGSWGFRSIHVKDGEVIAVHVYGGIKGNNATRFFRPERVTPITAKPKRRKKGEPIEEEEVLEVEDESTEDEDE